MSKTKVVKVKFPRFQSHPSQELVLKDKTRFKVVDAGRRWGKTHLALREAAQVGIDHPGCDIWVVSPTGPQQENIWNKALDCYNVKHEVFGGKFVKDIRSTRGYRHLVLYNGTQVWFKSAESVKSLLGGGDKVQYVIADEFAYWKPEAWKALRPVLIDNQAGAILISTPHPKHPKNHFYERWLWGQDYLEETCPFCYGKGCSKCYGTGKFYKENPHRKKSYKSWRFSSYDNPHISKEEIELLIAEEGWSQADIEREIYGLFTEGQGAVFRLEDIHNCIRGEKEPPQPGKVYVMGIDFGRSQDYTVVIVIDVERAHVVHYDRFQGAWPYQRKRIASIYHTYNRPLTIVDATNMGSVLEQDLYAEGMTNIYGYHFNGPTKVALIDSLRVAIETGEISFPPWPELERELGNYQGEVLASGIMSYRAAKGYHDDIVTALALAWYGYCFYRSRGTSGALYVSILGD